MSKLRLIPKLQLKPASYNSNKLVLVVTKQFDSVVEIGDPVSQSKIFQDQISDELIFINIDIENRKKINLLAKVICDVSEEIFMPLTVGGGVCSLDDFRLLLNNGADKISINSAAISNPNFIKIAAEKFGSQCVVVSIDFKKDENGEYFVYTNCGKKKTSYHPVEWALLAQKHGAGELLLTSISHDGMKNGLDLNIIKEVSSTVSIPVIASGGCGLSKDFSDGFITGKASAVAAGSFFAHRDQNFMQTRSHIYNSGVNIRK
jgi:imidazole glycerol-phosphate synthase subunit HisF